MARERKGEEEEREGDMVFLSSQAQVMVGKWKYYYTTVIRLVHQRDAKQESTKRQDLITLLMFN
jgi:hypothetical protein